jgi:Spy/CpxP family protein refolding chaperone
MRKLIILTSSVAAVALLGITVVDAQRPARGRQAERPAVGAQAERQGPAFDRGRVGRMGGPEGRHGGAGPMLGRGLELTEEQQAAVQAARVTSRDQSAPVADELQVARRALHRAVFADEVNESEVNEHAAQVGTLEGQLSALRLQSELAVSAILTTEQKAIARTQQGRGGPGRGPGRGAGRGR